MPQYLNIDKKYRTRKELLKYVLCERPATYSDSENTTLICGANCNRSITDLQEICNGYFKITSLKAVVRIIKELMDSGLNASFIYCTTVNKVVILNDSTYRENYITRFSRRNHYYDKGVDGYSLEDFENIINNLN